MLTEEQVAAIEAVALTPFDPTEEPPPGYEIGFQKLTFTRDDMVRLCHEWRSLTAERDAAIDLLIEGALVLGPFQKRREYVLARIAERVKEAGK